MATQKLKEIKFSTEMYTKTDVDGISSSVSSDIMDYASDNLVKLSSVQGDITEDNKIGTQEYIDGQVSSNMTYYNSDESLSVTLGKDAKVARLKGTLVNGEDVELFVFGYK